MNEQLNIFVSEKTKEIPEPKIDYQITGDPFVDVGSLVLEEISKRFSDKTLMEKIEFACRIYVEKWEGKIHALFQNSPITQPAFKGNRKTVETLDYFDKVFEEIHSEKIYGFCKTCGFEGTLFFAGRGNFCLSGSKAFGNFHNSHELGSFLCKNCITKLFFLPFGVIQLGGDLGLLQFQSKLTKEFWLSFVVLKNFDKISRNSSEGILKSDFKNPQNALFHFAKVILLELEKNEKNEFRDENLTLIHFTNFGASPDSQIYSLANPVFKFLCYALRREAIHWNSFVKRHYKIKGAKWNWNSKEWEQTKKKITSDLQESEFLNNSNDVFENLLASKSILSKLFSYQKLCFKNQIEKFPLSITLNYARIILKMKEEQIDLIRKITNVIFSLSKKENDYKKFIRPIEGANKAFKLRSHLVRLNKENFNNGEKEPMIRLNEYVDYLFPDGQSWSEVRDLLLICIYERFHEEGINSSEVGLYETEILSEDEEQTHI